MATLIAAYGSEGCEGRCDAKCYDAKHPGCDCICGGKNHGAGRKQAEANTQALAETWIREWSAAHPGQSLIYEVPAAQLRMFA
jgi:hypothetical protein